VKDDVTVTVSMDGGIAAFPGLAQEYTVASSDLTPEEAEELERLADAFLTLKEPEPDPRFGGPDSRTYTVTVTSGDQERTLTLTDPLPDDPAIRRLVEIVEERRRRR
jgi:Emfourin